MPLALIVVRPYLLHLLLERLEAELDGRAWEADLELLEHAWVKDAELANDEILLGMESRFDVLLELGELGVLDGGGTVVDGGAAAREVRGVYEDMSTCPSGALILHAPLLSLI